MLFITSILQQCRLSMELSYPDINIADIASKTEGYVYRDMQSLINRAIHFALMARMEQTSCNYEQLYLCCL